MCGEAIKRSLAIEFFFNQQHADGTRVTFAQGLPLFAECPGASARGAQPTLPHKPVPGVPARLSADKSISSHSVVHTGMTSRLGINASTCASQCAATSSPACALGSLGHVIVQRPAALQIAAATRTGPPLQVVDQHAPIPGRHGREQCLDPLELGVERRAIADRHPGIGFRNFLLVGSANFGKSCRQSSCMPSEAILMGTAHRPALDCGPLRSSNTGPVGPRPPGGPPADSRPGQFFTEQCHQRAKPFLPPLPRAIGRDFLRSNQQQLRAMRRR